MTWKRLKETVVHALVDDEDIKDVTLGDLILVAAVLPFTIGVIQLFTTGLEPVLCVAPSCTASLYYLICHNRWWFNKKL